MKLKHVLVIDDNVTNLKFAEKILKPYYKVSLLISGAQALKFLSKNTPDLILLDINMPDMDGYKTLKKIRENQDLDNTPVIFLTALSDSESELGAVDFIIKPFIPQTMLSRVKMHLEFSEYKNDLEDKVHEKTEIIEHLQDVMMLSLAELVECRDENIGGHVKRTAEYVKILTDEIVEARLYSDILTAEYIRDIVRSAPLHDIGKIYELYYDGPFKYTLRGEMEGHIVIGIQMIEKAFNDNPGFYSEDFITRIKGCIVQHHGKLEYGSPREMRMEESFILNSADSIDATMNKIEQIKEKTEAGSWSEYDRRIETKLYL